MFIKGMGIAKNTTEVVSCLEGFEKIYYRRSGNTTRLIGRCIDIMFSGKVALVRDHYLDGTNHKVNRELFKKVQKRIYNEHKNTFDLVCFDVKNLAIYLYQDLEEKKMVEG